MALNVLKFIGLTVVATTIGVLSAAVSFNSDRTLFFGPFSIGYGLLETAVDVGISKGETVRGLRHIVER